LAAERKEDKETRWTELKALDDEKWWSKLAVEQRMIILDGERMAKENMIEGKRLAHEAKKLDKEREGANRTIMFMDPS
jgi:hypothetical protein